MVFVNLFCGTQIRKENRMSMNPVIENLFDEVFGLVRPSGFDSWEENDLLFLRLEVPGYDKENISVAAENGTIVIEAAREQPKREYLVRSTVDKFRKVINVPPMWSLDKIDASYVNGTLVMTVEKDKKKTKKVQIK